MEYVLGKLCRLGHEHNSTGMSLWLKEKKGGCVVCIALRKKDPKMYANLHSKAQKRTHHGLVATKKYYRENVETFRENSQRCQANQREKLGRSYIRAALRDTLKIPTALITPELEQMKREQLLLFRAIRRVKNAFHSSRISSIG